MFSELKAFWLWIQNLFAAVETIFETGYIVANKS